MAKIKLQIKSIFRNVLFEYEKEDNTIKDTVEEAIRQRANLSEANLRSADLSCANLSDVLANETTAMFFSQCPTEGSFIAWKKAQGKIIKLKVTEDAKRSSATTLKSRCSKAEVLDIQEKDGRKSVLIEIASNHDSSFIYKIGEIVEVEDFDNNRWNECSTGIHFFIDREMAVRYN